MALTCGIKRGKSLRMRTPQSSGQLLKLVCLFLVASGAILYAQGTSGNITGQVLDPSGLAVPGARVAATNLATNVPTTTTSTDSGNYNIVVYPGVYRVTAEAGGF